MKKRIDQLLVERGLAESRNQAQALVMAGHVLVDDQKVEKSGQSVREDADIRVLEKLPYVSRAGLKLQGALDQFQIAPAGRICADLGASTGGFTDCLLQRGAREVHAFDVGRNLLAWKLQTDLRVKIHEGFNVRNLTAADLPQDVTLVTLDLSFISLTKILQPLKQALLGAHAGSSTTVDIDLILLVKPQFEVGKGEVGKGGIVRDAAKRLEALQSVEKFAREAGFAVAGSIPSPVAGAKGNQEFLLYLRLRAGL